MIPSGKCQQRGDLRCKDYFTRIYQDQNSVYQLGRQQLGSLIVLVIPPQPNIAKRTMGVHMLILFIRFWVPLPHWAMVQPMLLLHRTASVSPWRMVASTHVRTCPRAPVYHLPPIMPFSWPSGAVQHLRTQSWGCLRIGCSELPDPVHRCLVKSYTQQLEEMFPQFYRWIKGDFQTLEKSEKLHVLLLSFPRRKRMMCTGKLPTHCLVCTLSQWDVAALGMHLQ